MSEVGILFLDKVICHLLMLSGVDMLMRKCCCTIEYYQNQHFFSFNLNPKSKASFFSELIEMAEYTKATTTKLIKFTKRLSKDNSPKFNQQFEDLLV